MIIYKIVPVALWRDAEEAGVFAGSPVDVRDGFIHFSTQAQLAETAAKHFAGQRDLLRVAVDADRLDLRWEPSRGGDVFPHLYGVLPLSVVASVESFEPPAGPGAPSRVFLLSPANCSGKRAQQLLRPDARGELATRLRSDQGLALGALFAFMSGLYFRGKLAYATRFAAPPRADHPAVGSGVHIITPNGGLRDPSTIVRHDDVIAFSKVSIDVENSAYRQPLEESARRLSAALDVGQVVLLGSIASPKYVDVLLEIFGTRLCFPSSFVGRGDMSRGGLLLRQVASGEELDYVPVAGAVRHGARPPKLVPIGADHATGRQPTLGGASRRTASRHGRGKG